MKELTIEEKAQAYDEAIKRAKELLEIGLKDTRDKRVVLSFFPELKENEDERIREVLIELFSKWGKKANYCWGLKSSDIIAWLEKQSEHADFLSKIQVGDKVTRNEGGVLVNISQLERVAKPRRVKPTDKVEPKFKVKYAGSEYNVLEVKDIAGVTYYGIEDEPNHIDYVKAENCDIISGYAIKENGSPYPAKSAVFSEQKPAEWSEEDEMIVLSIEQIMNRASFLSTPKQMNEIRTWLKSLKNRYTWKPIEEQMKTLEYYMHTLRATEHKEVLFGLYSELKQLKQF